MITYDLNIVAKVLSPTSEFRGQRRGEHEGEHDFAVINELHPGEQHHGWLVVQLRLQRGGPG